MILETTILRSYNPAFLSAQVRSSAEDRLGGTGEEDIMGVKKLWPVLESAGQPVTLRDLRGYRVAVDLTFWIKEMSSIVNKDGEKMRYIKPHLR